MTTATRTNPLSYLTDQLNELKAKGTHFKLRVLDDEQAPVCTLRRQEGHQPGLEQLPGADDASQAARGGARGDAQIWRGIGRGAHHCRHDEDPHGAGGKDRALQECRGLRGLPVGIRGECGDGVGGAGQGRFHHLRRAEPRLDHRRRAALEGEDSGVPPQRHRARGRAASQHQGRARQEAADHRRRLLDGRRHRPAARRCAIWPKNTAPS